MQGQHGDKFELVGAVLAEVVNPVIIGLTQGQREPRVHMVAGNQAEASGGEEDRNVNPLYLHAHHLCFGIVVARHSKIEPTLLSNPGARQRLCTMDCAIRVRTIPLAVLLQVSVHREGQAINDNHAAAGTAVRSDRQNNTMLALRVQIGRKEVWRLHNMHIAVDKPEPVFHNALLGTTCMLVRSGATRALLPQPSLAAWRSGRYYT